MAKILNKTHNAIQKNKDFETQPTKTWEEHSYRVSAPLVAPVVLLWFQTRWQVMNEERIRSWLRQIEHIRGYLCHTYFVAFNQVIFYDRKTFEMMTLLHCALRWHSRHGCWRSLMRTMVVSSRRIVYCYLMLLYKARSIKKKLEESLVVTKPC